MNNRIVAVSLLVLGAVVVQPLEAEAYCVLADRWTPPPGPIPVYVSTDQGYGTSLGYTGIGIDYPHNVDDEVRWVKAAIAIVNEGSHGSDDGPRLYYAGTDPSVQLGATFWSSRNVGITISVYGCAYEPDDEFANFDKSGNKGAIRMLSGAGAADYGDPSATDYSCFDGNMAWWIDPSENPPIQGVSDNDFVSVLVHEFGHALGLGHTDGSSTCDAIGFPYVETAQSVMYVPSWWPRGWRRRLRRDDIEGLRALWGEPLRTMSWSYATYASPLSGQWTAPTAIPTPVLNTPASISTSTRGYDTVMLGGFTNANDQIRYFTGAFPANWSFGIFGAGFIVPHPSGGSLVTYDHVAVARGQVYDPNANPTLGPERRIVAWHGTDELTCCGPERVVETPTEVADTRIWWRVWDGTAWLTPQRTATTKYKELGAGYDPLEDQFILAYIDTCLPTPDNLSCQNVADSAADQWLFVKTIKAWTVDYGCTQALTTAEHVLGVGNVSCDLRSGSTPTRCVIPITTVSEFGGPMLRFIEGEIKDHDGAICFVREVDPPTTMTTVAYGTPGGAFEGYNNPPLSRFVGAYVPGFSGTDPATDDWARIYRMSRDSEGWIIPTMSQERAFPTDFWPISVGSLTQPTGTDHVQWRAISY